MLATRTRRWRDAVTSESSCPPPGHLSGPRIMSPGSPRITSPRVTSHHAPLVASNRGEASSAGWPRDPPPAPRESARAPAARWLRAHRALAALQRWWCWGGAQAGVDRAGREAALPNKRCEFDRVRSEFGAKERIRTALIPHLPPSRPPTRPARPRPPRPTLPPTAQTRSAPAAGGTTAPGRRRRRRRPTRRR